MKNKQLLCTFTTSKEYDAVILEIKNFYNVISGKIFYTVPFDLFGSNESRYEYTFGLYIDNQENKHYLRVEKKRKITYINFLEYNCIIYIDLDKYEVTSEDKIGIDKFDMSYNNECELCKKSSNLCNGEYFTLIEAISRYKFIVSKEFMGCKCYDSDSDSSYDFD